MAMGKGQMGHEYGNGKTQTRVSMAMEKQMYRQLC